MLLGPQLPQQVGDPAVDRPEPVQARMAGVAEGDQGRGGVGETSVVDNELCGGAADAAEPAVAGKDFFAPAAKRARERRRRL